MFIAAQECHAFPEAGPWAQWPSPTRRVSGQEDVESACSFVMYLSGGRLLKRRLWNCLTLSPGTSPPTRASPHPLGSRPTDPRPRHDASRTPRLVPCRIPSRLSAVVSEGDPIDGERTTAASARVLLPREPITPEETQRRDRDMS